ncbi:MAG: hypothetical protein WD802_07365 [Gemmatimonadaceae bacterium]
MRPNYLKLPTTARIAITVTLLSIATHSVGAQGVFPQIDPAIVARLTTLSLPAYQAVWRDTAERPRYDRQRIAVLITTRNCIGARDPRFVPGVRAALRLMAQQARRDSVGFSATGVAMDWEIDSGAVFLRQLADFDQWVVGRNWGNDAVVRLIWRDSTAIPSIPQLVILERSVGQTASGMYFGPEQVIHRLHGPLEIANWVLSGADSVTQLGSRPRTPR